MRIAKAQPAPGVKSPVLPFLEEAASIHAENESVLPPGRAVPGRTDVQPGTGFFPPGLPQPFPPGRRYCDGGEPPWPA